MFTPLYGDEFRLRRSAEPFRGLIRPKVIVELGHDDHQRDASVCPSGDLRIRRAVQRRRQQDCPVDLVSQAVLQGHFGTERPAHDPRVRQAAIGDEGHRRREVAFFEDALAELSLGHAARGSHAPKVKTDDGEIRQCGQPRRGLPDDVGIHETARCRQRMQGHDGGDGRDGCRESQLPDQCQCVIRVQLDIFADGGKLDAPADLDGHGVILQQWVCQCLRAARSSTSPMIPSARQATVCATPGKMSRPQPGQM